MKVPIEQENKMKIDENFFFFLTWPKFFRFKLMMGRLCNRIGSVISKFKFFNLWILEFKPNELSDQFLVIDSELHRTGVESNPNLIC